MPIPCPGLELLRPAEGRSAKPPPEALAFIADLHRASSPVARAARDRASAAALCARARRRLPPETALVREGDWTVASIRRPPGPAVEITGPSTAR